VIAETTLISWENGAPDFTTSISCYWCGERRVRSEDRPDDVLGLAGVLRTRVMWLTRAVEGDFEMLMNQHPDVPRGAV
jgi:hypothetical protein